MTSTKLNGALVFETVAGIYTITEQIGEGGAGRVYGGRSPDGESIALKLLMNAQSDKRKRFKNEIAFLERNRHKNIVTVIDRGVSTNPKCPGPFYVMRRYTGSLRDEMRKGLSAEDVLRLYAQVLDGVEASHLQNTVHRDLKPENLLYDSAAKVIAVSDFGVASFQEEDLLTAVATKEGQRLANFQYAAPEQRERGRSVSVPADIWALGLILHEMATGIVPHGTAYKTIADTHPELGYLDPIVSAMIANAPERRPKAVADVRAMIARYRDDFASGQRLSRMQAQVVPLGAIEDPLATDPPRLVDAKWDGRQLHLTLDREVSADWVYALQNLPNKSYVMGFPPEQFDFERNRASVVTDGMFSQQIVDHFKQWLAPASEHLRYLLEQRAQQEQHKREQQLLREREREEQLQAINKSLRV